jgi:mercuric ion binding protein
MKRIVIVLGLLLCSSAASFGKGKIITAKITTNIYCDHCQKCESCAQRIEDALYNIKGVKRVDVLDKENKIVVVYNSTKTNEDTIKEAITANGFDADNTKASPAGVAALDACCQPRE